MYQMTGYFTFQPESRNHGLEILDQIVSIGLTEEGMIRYKYYSDPADENRYFLYEEWESKSAHAVHFNRTTVRELVEKFFESLAEPPEVIYYEAKEESRR